jgi:UPF0755 protein
MKKVLWLALLALIPVAIVLGIYRQPLPEYAGPVFVEIPRGASTARIGEMLEDAGLIRSRLLVWVWKLQHPRRSLQAGEYRFATERSVEELLGKVARGDVHYEQLTIPEGASIFDIAQLVEEQGLMKAAEFLNAARNGALVRDLDPSAATLEGYLFPSTYRLPRRVTAEGLCQMLTRQFREVWKNLGSDRPVREVVTLASLVEKETAAGAERPRIAALFGNRLRLGMKLECDPTVIYAALLENRYRGKIYRSDLDNPHPYNTYRHAGLPPGPIANPGRESLEAVLKPEPTEAIFFVAEPGGTGRHVFSKTLAEHNRAVEAYRRGEGR